MSPLPTRHLLKPLFFAALIGPALPVRAEQEGDFTYTVQDKAVTITKYTGKGGEVVIPDSIAGMPVKTIGGNTLPPKGVTAVKIPASVTTLENFAFAHSVDLAAVTIPASVTTIKDSPFVSCKALQAISVDPANKAYRSIDGVLFANAGPRLVEYPSGKAGDYQIPKGTAMIADWAFTGCQELTAVTIPPTVKAIGRSGFSECAKLKSIVVPDTVTSMGDGVFFSCQALESATLGSGITGVSKSTFRFCANLASVKLPPTVTAIGPEAFKGCEKLSSIALPPALISIGGDSFNLCTSLTTVTIPAKVTSIGSYAFGRSSRLTSVIFQGNAPAMDEKDPFAMTTAELAIRYPKNATGFTTPDWKGHKAMPVE